MGFTKVYKSLQELFPQVDIRILKAVAIEHSKDLNAAIDDIISDILPHLSKITFPCLTPRENLGLGGSHEENTIALNEVVENVDVEPSLVSCPILNGNNDANTVVDLSSSSLYEAALERSSISVLSDNSEGEPEMMISSLATDKDINVNSGLSPNDLNSIAYCNHDLEHTPSQGDLDSCFGADNDSGVADCEKKSNGSVDFSITEENFAGEILNTKDESTLVTRSGQICNGEFLEELIEDAKNNKKILCSAMESVIITMREVEDKEKIVVEAKEVAARAGLDILSKTEELKKMSQHAKELNDMHKGEVYGERSILATEAKELQSRLLSLSDERDKSLAILDEMRQSLEAQLVALEEERKVAEKEKVEKEESAERAFAEQKHIMEKVVQESNVLQQEAEENSKLRDFLIDRGRVVDTLQGEISVICQDVRLMKDRLDKKGSIMSSSTSSMKSLSSLHVLDQWQSLGSSKKSTPDSSIYHQSPKINPGEKQSGNIFDDEWDMIGSI